MPGIGPQYNKKHVFTSLEKQANLVAMLQRAWLKVGYFIFVYSNLNLQQWINGLGGFYLDIWDEYVGTPLY